MLYTTGGEPLLQVEDKLNPSPEPELRLTDTERVELAQAVNMAGFRAIQKIMRSAVDKFILATMNADIANPREIIAKHRLAKAAIQFYAQVVKDVNSELSLALSLPHPSDKPVDVTEGILDVGEGVTGEIGGEDESEF
jgi:hypothetical protein